MSYGMFTKAGNQRVATIVRRAERKGWTWAETYRELTKLGQDSRYSEATDTAVREAVYVAARFHITGQDFYI